MKDQLSGTSETSLSCSSFPGAGCRRPPGRGNITKAAGRRVPLHRKGAD